MTRVTLICPNLQCRRTVVVREVDRGKIIRCIHCQQVFLVPARQGPLRADQELTDKGKAKRTDQA